MTDTTRNGITKSNADDAWRTLMTYYTWGEEWRPGETEEEKLQEDASFETCNIITALAHRHNPEHFMLTLDVLFAQGVALNVSEEEQKNTLEEFVYRLRKYDGGDDLVRQVQKLCKEILSEPYDPTAHVKAMHAAITAQISGK
jgi:hypothetical protein